MTDLQQEEIQNLKALALAATPGPWECDTTRCTHDSVVFTQGAADSENAKRYGYIGPEDCIVGSSEWIWTRDQDAAYIAAANPAVILSLIAQLEARPAVDEAVADDSGALKIACFINKKLGEQLKIRREAFLLPDDLTALQRFAECCDDFDSGGHDVSKEAMARLREIGVVESRGFGRHRITSFGDYVLGRWAGADFKLPLKTLQEYNDDAARAAKGQA